MEQPMNQKMLRRNPFAIWFSVFLLALCSLDMILCLKSWIVDLHMQLHSNLFVFPFLFLGWVLIYQILFRKAIEKVFVSPSGVTVMYHKKVLQELSWEEIAWVYVPSRYTNKLFILFAKGPIEKPFRTRWRDIKKEEPNFLYMMYYTKAAAAVLSEYAAGKLIEA